ncbi:MAG: YlxR family protein [Bacillota bacterium]|nr:YlxR family protein [Bacillota bacterium]
MRMCVGCQEMKPKRDMVRIVRTPEGEVLVDPTGKKSGRGVYVCPDHGCVEKAVKTRRLEKALGREMSPEVLETVRLKVRESPGAASGCLPH